MQTAMRSLQQKLRIRNVFVVVPLFVTLFLGVFSVGCIHQTVIRTEPAGADLEIDGVPMGAGPVVVERPLGLFGDMTIRVEQASFESHTHVVQRSEWFLWPAALAIIPFFALPFVVIPVAGPFIALGWAGITSPALLGLLFIRRYPAEVVLDLSPRISVIDDIILPTDGWTVPDSYSPNPLPLGALPEPPDPAALPLPQNQDRAKDERNPDLDGLRHDDSTATQEEDQKPAPLPL